MRRTRVAVGPEEIAGVASGVTRALASVGVDVQLVLGHTHSFAYDEATTSPAGLSRAWRRLGDVRQSMKGRNRPARLALTVAHRGVAWLVLGRQLCRCNSFIYLFGRTYTNSRLELLALRLLRKRVVFYYLGSEARPLWMGMSGLRLMRDAGPAELARSIRRQERLIHAQEKVALACVTTGTTSQFLTRPYVELAEIGLAQRVEETQPRSTTPDPIRALHSPSDPELKGTARIQETVERLRSEGVALELIMLTGRPNAEVLTALDRVDFVIDQVYSDVPCAVFATEAAMRGVPAVVAGYAVEWHRKNPSSTLSTEYVHPDDLHEAVRRLATDAARRQELAAEARAFAAVHLADEEVGQRLRRLLSGESDATWWREPASAPYVMGCGVPVSAVREMAQALIDHGGVDALALPNRAAFAGVLDELLGQG